MAPIQILKYKCEYIIEQQSLLVVTSVVYKVFVKERKQQQQQQRNQQYQKKIRHPGKLENHGNCSDLMSSDHPFLSQPITVRQPLYCDP